MGDFMSKLTRSTGDRELGAGNWGHQTGDRELGTRTWGQGTGGGESCTRESQMIRGFPDYVVFGQFEISKTEKQFHGGALLCFKKPEALLCVVERVFCCWRRWNHGPEV